LPGRPRPTGLADEATCWIRIGTGSEPLAAVEPVEPEPVEVSLSEHEAVEPPLLPPQVQLQGPLPLTADAVPVLQRLALGFALTVAAFELPHAPLTGCAEVTFLAKQVTVVPPPLPAQVHAHGPLPLTVDAVPALQRGAVGALVRLPPFEGPHAPVTAEEAACAESGNTST
jgi:hypothetical protein